MPTIRYIVVDLNVLDLGLHQFVERDDHLVLPHAMASDIIGNKHYDKHAKKFPEWFRDHGDQIWISHEWATLVDRERSPKSRTIGLAWRDDAGTQMMRISATTESDKWAGRMDILKNSDIFKGFEEARKGFLEMCHDFANHIKESQSEVYKRLKSNQNAVEAAQLIQEPRLGGLWPRKWRREYRTKKWQESLDRFPDVKAAGRLSRIICWYALLEVMGWTKKFENNYEDAAYAFTASYTGHIATDDGRLQDMIEAIFPHVTIHRHK